MSCLGLFKSLAEDEDVSQRSAKIEEAYPECYCEIETVSTHSKGPVANDEFVFRHIFSPLHIDPDSKAIRTSAFSDAEDKGMSVERATDFNDQDALIKRGRILAAVKGRTLHAVLAATCGDVRTLEYENGKQAFAVYDTALEENPFHSDVFQQNKVVGASKSQRGFLRKKLRDLFLQRQVDTSEEV